MKSTVRAKGGLMMACDLTKNSWATTAILVGVCTTRNIYPFEHIHCLSVECSFLLVYEGIEEKGCRLYMLKTELHFLLVYEGIEEKGCRLCMLKTELHFLLVYEGK